MPLPFQTTHKNKSATPVPFFSREKVTGNSPRLPRNPPQTHHKKPPRKHALSQKTLKNQYYRVPAFFPATDFFPETFFAALAGTALFFATFLAADFTATAFLTGVLVTAFAATDFFGVFAREAVMRALTSALRSVTLMVVAVLRRRSRP